MTEEEIKALQEAKEEAERKAKQSEEIAEAARAEAEKARNDINQVVEELKEERRKKQEALGNVNINKDDVDVETAIQRALEEREAAQRKTDFENALKEFKTSKSEFQSDDAGLVFSKFEKQMSKFNFSDIKSKDEYKRRLEEVYKFHKGTSQAEQESDFEGTPTSNYTPQSKDTSMSPGVNSVLENARITPERYAKLKEKYGDAMEGLGL